MKSEIIYTNKMGRGRKGLVSHVQPGDIVTYCIESFQTAVVATVFPKTKEIVTEPMMSRGTKIRGSQRVSFRDVWEVRRPFKRRSRKAA